MERDAIPDGLSAEQRAALEQAIRTVDKVRLYKRLKVVQLASEGYPHPLLAQLFGVCPRSVAKYVHAYAVSGVAGLEDAPRSGRPRKLPREYDGGPDTQAQWRRLLDRRPATIPELQTPSHVWTLGLLARYMRIFHHVEVAESTIYNVLTRAGFRRGRTKLTVTSPDPDYEVKRQRIEALGRAPGQAS
jgi:transposase